MRGTRLIQRPRDVDSRFIPACAGNALILSASASAWSVHPRVCGERDTRLLCHRSGSGSSPRVRGTHGVTELGDDNRRFIPACAGNAKDCRKSRHPSPVHPRVCGERCRFPDTPHRARGSSPRVRGTRLTTRSGICRDRFIPACAGNASPRRDRCRTGPVHPRVCGERVDLGILLGQFRGSSPRVRGTLRRARPVAGIGRFIPACAGNAASLKAGVFFTPVHPRVCGERLCDCHNPSQGCGSSPRVRGTLAFWKTSDLNPRFIPACAGNAR